MRLRYDERLLRQLVRDLESVDPSEVQVESWIGSGSEAERSLYKLRIRATRTGQWYLVEGSIGVSWSNVPTDGAVAVRGDLNALAGVTCNPNLPALVRVLAVAQARLLKAAS